MILVARFQFGWYAGLRFADTRLNIDYRKCYWKKMGEKITRLFFALWPDDEVRAQIAKNLNRINFDHNKNRLVTNSNLHITLHFVGNTPIDQMGCLDRQARQCKGEPFDLTLDCSGYFKKPKVFWFGPQRVPRSLSDLHRNLGDMISECEYTPETRPYSPHVTVVRKIYQAPEPVALEPVHWQVDRFVMVESVSVPRGVRYEVVKSYPLD
jgi:2'-5' RNA ligase